MKATQYKWSNTPSAISIDWEGWTPDWRAIVHCAGFNVDDDEVGVGVLNSSFNEHPKGSFVVTAQTTDGCRFAIVEKP